MTRRSSAQRLARLLAIVPWVVAHDGPLVSEVCERFRISERELIADLNLLFMCGVYPYTPDALIEVDLEGGRVWVRFAEWFRRPLRLSAPEGLALVAAARAILGMPATGNDKPSALASAVAKLETVLGAGGDDQLEIELGAASPDLLGALQAAVGESRKVLLDYYSFGRDETGHALCGRGGCSPPRGTGTCWRGARRCKPSVFSASTGPGRPRCSTTISNLPTTSGRCPFTKAAPTTPWSPLTWPRTLIGWSSAIPMRAPSTWARGCCGHGCGSVRRRGWKGSFCGPDRRPPSFRGRTGWPRARQGASLPLTGM